MKLFSHLYPFYKRRRLLLCLLMTPSVITGCMKPSQGNVLAKEKSPYLLQHKDNPVWWKSWGEDAFKLARKENKVIFLSIGYSTCHWCHVMEHECFEDEQVAQALNDNFISIKVDREERPDVDKVYMSAIHAMGLRGGWPLSIFLTPDLKPITGGTYFPKQKFLSILEQVQHKWKTEHDRIQRDSDTLTEHLKKQNFSQAIQSTNLTEEILKKSYHALMRDFDSTHGGFGRAPKFPPTMRLRLLLRLAFRTKKEADRKAMINIVDKTLTDMFKGGVYDHVGGGFHRYSTDARWLVPHFEKMLYDNAVLASTYIEAFQTTQNPLYKEVAVETLQYVLRDMSQKGGGYYSAEDADSEGEEGIFYIWTEDELRKVLSKVEFKKIKELYGTSEKGNFEHQNILNLIAETKPMRGFDPPIKAIRKKLFDHREKRIHPLKDDKILTAWNGLMISAMAKAYQVFKDERYLTSAQETAAFIREKLDRNDRLQRRYRKGEARFEATLDDYAYLIAGLLDLYESNFDPQWIKWAVNLQKRQDDILWSQKSGAYLFAKKSADLVIESIDFTDDARPNSNAISLLNLQKLYNLTYRKTYREKVDNLFSAQKMYLEKYPNAVAQLLHAVDFELSKSPEIAIIGDPKDPITLQMLKIVREDFFPHKGVAFAEPKNIKAFSEIIPLLKDRTILQGKPTAFVCFDKTCKLPVNDIKEFKMQILPTQIQSL